MISLDLFKSIISHIKQQEENTGWVSTANDLIDDLVKLLEYELGDKYEYVSWWLYDITDGNKFVYEDFKEDKQVRFNLNSPEDLYYYIIGDLEAVKQDVVDKNKEENSYTMADSSVVNEIFDTIWSETDEL